ncbi:MAG: hypothetical protein IPK21_16270 [Haliscomenobacter sp.]|nr:hypothetical protein [Haliscomenobacter sp.]
MLISSGSTLRRWCLFGLTGPKKLSGAAALGNNSRKLLFNGPHDLFRRGGGKTVIFLEHYPLLSRETTLTKGWKPAQALFLTALDEPLFSRFGGDRLVNLVQQLGLEETENLEHPMITKSIARAQRKLDEKLKEETSWRKARKSGFKSWNNGMEDDRF